MGLAFWIGSVVQGWTVVDSYNESGFRTWKLSRGESFKFISLPRETRNGDVRALLAEKLS